MDNNNNNGNSVNSTLSQRVNLIDSQNLLNNHDMLINQNIAEITDEDSDWEFPRDK